MLAGEAVGEGGADGETHDVLGPHRDAGDVDLPAGARKLVGRPIDPPWSVVAHLDTLRHRGRAEEVGRSVRHLPLVVVEV
ncbi:MAG: hypothetical protein ABI249_04890 [Ornithinibacter sp.]